MISGFVVFFLILCLTFTQAAQAYSLARISNQATSTYSQSYYSHTTESGLMSGGGIGFTIGSRSQTDQSNANGTLQSQNRSLVGSTLP